MSKRQVYFMLSSSLFEDDADAFAACYAEAAEAWAAEEGWV